jgi:hypothetical protein
MGNNDNFMHVLKASYNLFYCMYLMVNMKAFQNVNWNLMMKTLKMIEIDSRDRRLIAELHKHQTTSMKIKESKREAAIRKGVTQCCSRSPMLFNPYRIKSHL